MVVTLVLQPMIFLSGVVFPLQGLPGWLRVLTRLNPATYGVDMVRRVVLPGAAAVRLGGREVPLVAEVGLTLVLGDGLLALGIGLFRRAD